MSSGKIGNLNWYFNDLKTTLRHLMPSSKHVFTQHSGLVIIGVQDTDAGIYECKLGRETVSSYELSVDMQRCAAPNKTADYQKIYSEW